MREKIKVALGCILAVPIAILFFGAGIGTINDMPDNAHIVVDPVKKTYLAPQCIESSTGTTFTMVGEARKLGYKPDSKCRNSGYFYQDGRSLTGMLFQKVGVLKPIPPRWNKDGSWNY